MILGDSVTNRVQFQDAQLKQSSLLFLVLASLRYYLEIG